jgi:hypothetical protein
MRYGSALILSMLGASIATACSAQTPPKPAGNTGFPASMSVADRKQILQVASFDLSADLSNATRYCGDKEMVAKVGIGRRDINKDGKEEFFVLSQNDCPGGDGKLHAAIVFFDPQTKLYQNMLDVDGQPRIGPQTGTAWPQIDVTDGDKTTGFVFVASDSRYLPLSTVQYRKNLALARLPDKTPPGQLPTAGWATPWSIGNLTPGQIAQIFTAAGYKRDPRGWGDCDGASGLRIPTEEEIGNGSPIMDMNGDGNPEVIVNEICEGDNSGGRFTILTPVSGGWRVVGEGQDRPFFLKTRSRTGWLDYEEGGPGFCHTRDRNDGQGYRDAGQIEDTPGACSWR